MCSMTDQETQTKKWTLDQLLIESHISRIKEYIEMRNRIIRRNPHHLTHLVGDDSIPGGAYAPRREASKSILWLEKYFKIE